MKLFVRKIVDFVRNRWYLIAITFVVATSVIIFFRTSKPRPPKIKPSSSPEFVFEAKNQTFLAQIGNAKSPRPIVSFTSKAGGNVSFELEGESKASIEQKKNMVTFRGVNANTDISYTPLPNGIKEEIVLNNPVEKAEYVFNLSATNAKPRKSMEGIYSRFFYNDQGQYQFHIEKPFAIDAKGKKIENITMQIRGAKEDENKYQILISVPPEWLKSNDRSYPVTIDPTFIYDTTAEYAVGILDRLKDTGSANSPSLEAHYQEQTSDINTVGLWHLNEASGNALDSTGNSNTGTPTGTTVVSGLLGNARRFNGSSDYITVPNNSYTNVTGSISVGMWFKRTSGHVPNLIGKGTNNNYSYRLIATDVRSGPPSNNWLGGGITWGINSSYSNMQTNYTLCPGGAQVSPCPANWTHVVGTYDQVDNSVKLYINGELVSTGVASGPPTSNSAPVEIGLGRYDGSLFYFGGDMDDIFIKKYAMSPEEIKASASRRPSGVYTSDIIDFGDNVISWNPLLWTELGVATGNGETPFNSTGLVAQWNFNDTSGTTATADAGSCGATCNGTLTNFASTANTDQAPGGTGWTAVNRRWGAGALMFDGANDTVAIPHSALLKPSTQITIESWIKPTAGSLNTQREVYRKEEADRHLLSFQGGAANCGSGSDSCIAFGLTIGGSYSELDVNINASDWEGKWNHLVATYDGSTKKIYRNGILIGSVAASGSLGTSGTANAYIGSTSNAGEYFSGVIDTVRLYSRALTASEAMSNYQAGNIELQTRVGASADTTSSVADTFTNTTSINNGASSTYYVNNGKLTICVPQNPPVYTDADGDGYGAGSSVTCPVTGTAYSTNNSDCDDSTNLKWQLLNGYRDADNDTYGVATPTSLCTGNSVPAGYTTLAMATDCYDGNPNAKPGSTYCSTANRGDNSYDYNCEGGATKCGTAYYAQAGATGQGPSCGTYYCGQTLGASTNCGAVGWVGTGGIFTCEGCCGECGWNYATVGASGTQACQ